MTSFKLCLFAICIYGVCCLPDDEAKNKCMAEFNLSSYDPIDYFLKNGKFQPGFEHLKCYFNCFSRAKNFVDEKGVPLFDRINARDKHAVEACPKPPDGSTPCDATFSYVSCAVQLKLKRLAAAKKA